MLVLRVRVPTVVEPADDYENDRESQKRTEESPCIERAPEDEQPGQHEDPDYRQASGQLEVEAGTESRSARVLRHFVRGVFPVHRWRQYRAKPDDRPGFDADGLAPEGKWSGRRKSGGRPRERRSACFSGMRPA